MTQGSIFTGLPINEDSTHKPPPPLEDVRSLWDSLKPVASDVDAVRLLTERNINPELVDRFDLARVIPRGCPLPTWAAGKPREGDLIGRTWYENGHRLLIPLCDSVGTMRSLKARSVFFNPAKKTLNPLGYGTRGLCLLPLFERHRLEADPNVVRYRQSLPPGRWVVCEGDMDYLTWATRLVQNLDDPTFLVGIYSGAFSLAWAQALVGNEPARPPAFYIRIHHDKAGEDYTHKIGSLIRSASTQAKIYRSRASELPGHVRADDNKLAMSFLLNIDPRVDCFEWSPPIVAPSTDTVEPTQTKAGRARVSERTRNDKETRFYCNHVDSAIRKAADEVRASVAKGHNNELFRCASAVARFQHTPFWNDALFRSEMRLAAVQVGQSIFEAESTIASAFEAARRDPQDYSLPEFNPRAAPLPPKTKTTQKTEPNANLETSDNLDNNLTDDGELIEDESDDDSQISLRLSLGTYETQGAVAERAISSRPDTFQRNSALVQVLHTNDGQPIVSPLKQSHVRVRLDSALSCYVERKNKDGLIYKRYVAVPDRLVSEVHESGYYPTARPLNKVVKHPVMLPNETLAVSPGYYKEGGILYSPARLVTLDEIPDAPTFDDARAAYKELAEPFRDFMFGDKPAKKGEKQRSVEQDAGEAAVLSLILSHFARPMISIGEFVPAYLIDATTPGTGKSTLLSAINALCIGIGGVSVAESMQDSVEETKRMVSWALSGRTGMVVLDNAETGVPIGNSILDGVLTSGKIEARELGKNTMIDMPLDFILAVTGNNIAVRGDLVRRCVPIVLTAPPGDLTQREFHYPNLVEHIIANRGRLIRAALIILRAYAVAAKPSKPPKIFDSFPAWSRWCRDPLVWLGLPDFVAQSRSKASSSDATLTAFQTLLAALHKVHGSTLITTTRLRGIYEGAAQDTNQINQDIVEACDNLGFREMGKWRDKHVSRTLGGYQGRTLGGFALRPVVPFQKWTVEVVKEE